MVLFIIILVSITEAANLMIIFIKLLIIFVLITKEFELIYLWKTTTMIVTPVHCLK